MRPEFQLEPQFLQMTICAFITMLLLTGFEHCQVMFFRNQSSGTIIYHKQLIKISTCILTFSLPSWRINLCIYHLLNRNQLMSIVQIKCFCLYGQRHSQKHLFKCEDFIRTRRKWFNKCIDFDNCFVVCWNSSYLDTAKKSV